MVGWWELSFKPPRVRRGISVGPRPDTGPRENRGQRESRRPYPHGSIVSMFSGRPQQKEYSKRASILPYLSCNLSNRLGSRISSLEIVIQADLLVPSLNDAICASDGLAGSGLDQPCKANPWPSVLHHHGSQLQIATETILLGRDQRLRQRK